MAIVINGSGTVTGLAVGGLPDGTVDAGTLATNSVDSAELIDGAIDASHLASGINKTSITDGGNATAITIDSSEQVGIGTTSPDKKLDVSHTGNVYAKVQSTNSTAAGINLKTNGGSVEDWLMQADEGANGVAWYNTAYRMTLGNTGDLNINTGDLFFGTAGKGIVLGATSNTAANTLDDYEEGTWTPSYTVAGGGSHSSVANTNTGTYTKVGRMVTIGIVGSLVQTSGTITSYSVSLPFTAGDFPSSGMGDEYGQTGKGQKLVIANGASVMVITEYDGTPPSGNAYFSMGITYQTA